MNRELKMGDWVIIIDNYEAWGCVDYYRNGKDFKNSIGKIVRKSSCPDLYRIDIVNCPAKKECHEFKRRKHCITLDISAIKAYIDHLKLKKFVEHGV